MNAILNLGLALSLWTPSLALPQNDAAAAQESPYEVLGPASESTRKALLQGDFDKALGLLDELRTRESGREDRWMFYRGVTLQEAGRLEEAKQVFAAFPNQYPTSAWKLQALYRLAEVHRLLREFEPTGAIYRTALSELRGEQRQGELAQMYIDLADEAARPFDERNRERKPDLATATALYRGAAELQVASDLQAKAWLGAARCQFAQNRHAEAAVSAGKAEELSVNAHGPVWREASLLAAQSMRRAGRPAEGIRRLEAILAHRVADKDRDIRTWHTDAVLELHNAWKELRNENDAADTWLMALDRYPELAQESQVQKYLGEMLGRMGRTDEALAAWRRLAALPLPGAEACAKERQEAAELRRLAVFQQAQVLTAAEQYTPALEIYHEYVRQFPDGRNWADSQREIVNLRMAQANRLMEQKRWEEGREALRGFLRDYPLDNRVDNAWFELGQSFWNQGHAAEPVDKALIAQAVETWQEIARAADNANRRNRCLLAAASALETDLGRVQEAMEILISIADNGQAAGRIAALQSKELHLETRRVWYSDEPARIELGLRNWPSAKVQIFHLDLETWFRKHQSFGGVDELDLDLIAPGTEFEYTVPEYEPYRYFETAVDLPVEGPGVWAVAVETEEQRATVMVVRSDVDFVTKVTDRELFAYAQNMRTSQPLPGARLLLFTDQDGESRLNELTTDEQGIARLALAGNQTWSGEARALLVADGHVAGLGQEIQSGPAPVGLRSRGLIYTDRPAYEPGDRVFWKAIERSDSLTGWNIPLDGSCTVEWTDPQGTVYSREAFQLGSFGTVFGQWTLPEEATAGNWAVSLLRNGELISRQTVQVEHFVVPRSEVLLSTPDDVVMRGQKVLVTATAQTTYGAPLADAALAWKHPDGSLLQVRTDANGKAVLEVDTQLLKLHSVVSAVLVEATLTDENVSNKLAIRISDRGFSTRLSVDHPVALAGTQFPLHFRTLSESGEPVSKELQLEASIRSTGQGFVSLWKRTVHTDEQGLLDLPLAFQEGGLVILRATGTDRFGQQVSAQTQITISGQEDRTRLRLLADRTLVEPGEKLVLTAANREPAGVALLTVETSRVEAVRMVRLEQGTTDIEYTLGAEFAPTARLALTYLRRDGMLQAETSIEIRPRLSIVLELPEGEQPAGGTSNLRVRTTDSLGNPVPAEISMALVEDALFQIYPDQVPELAAHFRRPRTELPPMVTISSCGWSDAAEGSQISELVRQEAVRLAQVDREVQTLGRLRAQLGQELVLEEPEWDFEVAFGDPDEDAMNPMLGIGGGAGGKFGGRAGGRASPLEEERARNRAGIV
ncbi:MAG: MG2 domain-containing protein [Planctomycetota bacterium]